MSTALLLLDLQIGLCSPTPGATPAPLAEAVEKRNVLGVASALLDRARSRDLQVIHVRLSFDRQFANRTNRTARFNEHEQMLRFVSDSSSTQFCDAVMPIDGELVLEKGSVSPFASTAFETILHARGVDELIVGGVATHLAVESTVREAADRGFSVVVVEDACAAPAKHLHRAAVEETMPLFARVARIDDGLRALE